MSEGPSREEFEKEYRAWLISVSRDAARRLSGLSRPRRESVVKRYRELRDPGNVFWPLSDPERIERLTGGRASSYILVETDAITFFPSIYSSVPGTMDFAVAMNRRFYLRGLWFPIIALNSEYVANSSDKLLTFALEHEFEMARIYEKIALNLKSPSNDEKKDVAETAKKTSVESLNITREGLLEDEKLMIGLSNSQPLIPKPYCETALLLYLKSRLFELEKYGLKSRNQDEEEFGLELYSEFIGWSDFSTATYSDFVREIFGRLRDINSGYC